MFEVDCVFNDTVELELATGLLLLLVELVFEEVLAGMALLMLTVFRFSGDFSKMNR